MRLMKRLSAIGAALLGLAAANPAGAVDLAITVDDLPVHMAMPPGMTRAKLAQDMLDAFKAAGAPRVYGFINAERSQSEPGAERVLELWRKAGYPLANHTWSHMSLNQNPVEAWQADLLRNEPELKARMKGEDWRWVRFPYLHEGNTPEKRDAARKFVAEQGYKIASVTLDFSDWAFNDAYARCMTKNDAAGVARLETVWLDAAAKSLAYQRGLSKELYGREIPLVLLMHVGAFSARMTPALMDLYKREGVRLVTLEKAQSDPFYAADTKPQPTPAPLTLENALRARNLPVPAKTWNLTELQSLCV